MITNPIGQTALLRSLLPGKSFNWFCSSHQADPDMRKMTAAKFNAGITAKIKQTKALLIADDARPQAMIIVTRDQETAPLQAVNPCGKTDFLRSLLIGEPTVWFCDSKQTEPDMRAFTATVHRLNKVQPHTIKISQKTARIVFEDSIPQMAIIIERVL